MTITLNDDGDIFRALGRVCVYSAYIEDEMASLIKLTNAIDPSTKDISSYKLIDQSEKLQRVLKKIFYKATPFLSKAQELNRAITTLKNVIVLARGRNEALHSVYISERGEIVQQNPRSGSGCITTKEITALAQALLNIRADLMYVGNSINRLNFV